MQIITAPSIEIPYFSNLRIFLAGGISGCPDWQKDMIQILENRYPKHTVTIYNPRRTDFDISDPSVSVEQIKWEYQRLQDSDIIIFWFPEETLCPITLFELGSWLHSKKPIYIGCHPNYKRKLDVVTQVQLVRPTAKIAESLEDILTVRS